MKSLRPALALILVAPLVAEILPGSAPLSRPGLLPFIVLIYGPGALLIRDVLRRSGRGWIGILLLGAAYGFIEEGIALQSLFNPDLYNASAWGRLGPINAVYTEAVIPIHAIWSAAYTCGYRKFKVSRNGGAPPAIVTEIVAKMITLGLGNVREQALSWTAGAPLAERRPASSCVASGGTSFVTMVESADLRDRDHSAQLRRMHCPWLRRVLLQRQMRTGRVIVRKYAVWIGRRLVSL